LENFSELYNSFYQSDPPLKKLTVPKMRLSTHILKWPNIQNTAQLTTVKHIGITLF